VVHQVRCSLRGDTFGPTYPLNPVPDGVFPVETGK